jgi:hypothetical protein
MCVVMTLIWEKDRQNCGPMPTLMKLTSKTIVECGKCLPAYFGGILKMKKNHNELSKKWDIYGRKNFCP